MHVEVWGLQCTDEECRRRQWPVCGVVGRAGARLPVCGGRQGAGAGIEVDGPLSETGPWEPSTSPQTTRNSPLEYITTRINFISNNFNKFQHIINIYWILEC